MNSALQLSCPSSLQEMARVLSHPRVYSFLHVPVQCGSDSVLSDMKREYTVADFKHVVDFLKERYVQCYLTHSNVKIHRYLLEYSSICIGYMQVYLDIQEFVKVYIVDIPGYYPDLLRYNYM